MTTSAHDLVHRWWDGELGYAGTLLDALLAPAEIVFRAGAAARNAAYDRGLLPVERAAAPVISVGNLGVGGTGKTPFAAWLAARLKSLGRTPAILHGAYGEDEPELHRRWAPDVPVVAARDRAAGAARAIAGGADALVLDDAFQHRRLHRDLDIVLVSVERWRPKPRLLPRGPWREAPAALRRADLIVCTRKTAPAERSATIADSLRQIGGPPVLRAHLRPGEWRRAGLTAGPPPVPAVLVSALAEPRIFLESARAAGAAVGEALVYPDHHAYTRADAERIRDRADGRPIVTTEKDWTKLDRWLAADQVWLLTQDVVPEGDWTPLDDALERILS